MLSMRRSFVLHNSYELRDGGYGKRVFSPSWLGISVSVSDQVSDRSDHAFFSPAVPCRSQRTRTQSHAATSPLLRRAGSCLRTAERTTSTPCAMALSMASGALGHAKA